MTQTSVSTLGSYETSGDLDGVVYSKAKIVSEPLNNIGKKEE
jgi:hypothetical protein